jgi:hypothetical protein
MDPARPHRHDARRCARHPSLTNLPDEMVQRQSLCSVDCQRAGDGHGERVAGDVRGILVAGRSGRTRQWELAKYYLALTVMRYFGLAIIDQYENTFDSRIMCGDPAPDLKALSIELLNEFGLDVICDQETNGTSRSATGTTRPGYRRS